MYIDEPCQLEYAPENFKWNIRLYPLTYSRQP